MNQVTNLIQRKNLTQEQKDEFDFENYKYVYRLVIEDDKWYFAHDEVRLGKDWDKDELEEACECRPARPDEIPQQEKTLEQRIQERWPDKKVVMFGWSSANIWGWTTGNKTEHIKAQSMRGFHTYVYQRLQDDSFFPDTKAVYCWNEHLTLQPVAVLFER